MFLIRLYSTQPIGQLHHHKGINGGIIIEYGQPPGAKLTDPPDAPCSLLCKSRSPPELVRSVVMDIKVCHLLLLLVITRVRRVAGMLCDSKA